MATTDPALIVKVGANLDELKTGLTAADTAVSDFSRLVNDKVGVQAPAAMHQLEAATTEVTDSMGLLGGLVGGFLGGLSVDAVVKFAEAIVQMGDRLQTLHDRTELSTDELQRLQRIAATSGTTLDAFASAAFTLSRRLAEGKDSTIEALHDLGFTLQQIVAMTPDRRIEELAKALAALDDPLRRDRDGVALLGRGFDELIPAIKSLSEETGTHLRLSEEEVSMLAKLSNGFVMLKDSVLPAVTQFIDGALHASDFYDALQLLGAIAIKLPPVYGEAADGVKAWNEANKAWVAGMKIKVPTLATALEMDRQFAESEKEKARLAKEEEKELTELAKAYEAYLKSIDEMHKLTFEHVKETNKELLAAASARKAVINDAVVAELQATVKLNEAYGLTAAGVLKTSSAYETYLQKLHELSVAKVEGISQTAQETLITKEYTDALYAEALALDQETAKQQAASQAKAEAAQTVLPWSTLGRGGPTGTGTIQAPAGFTPEQWSGAVSDYYDSFAGNSAGTPGVGSYGNAAGPSAWNMPRMVGMGSGTAAVTNNYYVTQPLGTPQAIAAAVGSAQMAAMKAGGTRFRPAGV